MSKLKFLPHTKLGRCSTGIFLIFALALLARYLEAEFVIFHSKTADILEILFFFLEYLFGFIAWATGLISIIFYKERSALVLLYTLVPAALLLCILIKDFIF